MVNSNTQNMLSCMVAIMNFVLHRDFISLYLNRLATVFKYFFYLMALYKPSHHIKKCLRTGDSLYPEWPVVLS